LYKLRLCFAQFAVSLLQFAGASLDPGFKIFIEFLQTIMRLDEFLPPFFHGCMQDGVLYGTGCLICNDGDQCLLVLAKRSLLTAFDGKHSNQPVFNRQRNGNLALGISQAR
jgi:hypothetical protein